MISGGISNDGRPVTATYPAGVAEAEPGAAALQEPDDRTWDLFRVRITDVTVRRAIELMERRLRDRGRAASVYIVNAHTLNLAASDADYRAVLRSADHVFGDGTGVRWAARLQGLRVRDNLVGTDLLPALFHAAAGRGYSYFLLGADEGAVERAAAYARDRFTGWRQAGFHHGYLQDEVVNERVVREINRARPDLVLVAMGNPLQETWIHHHRHRLQAGLCVGVGGLFDIWAGTLKRPPLWLRRRGLEWLGILLQQPHKSRRYLAGNPLFLARIAAYSVARLVRPSPAPDNELDTPLC